MALKYCQLNEGPFSAAATTGEDSRSVGGLQALRSYARQMIVLRSPMRVVPADGSDVITVPVKATLSGMNRRKYYYVAYVEEATSAWKVAAQQDFVAIYNAIDVYPTHYITDTHIRHYQPLIPIVPPSTAALALMAGGENSPTQFGYISLVDVGTQQPLATPTVFGIGPQWFTPARMAMGDSGAAIYLDIDGNGFLTTDGVVSTATSVAFADAFAASGGFSPISVAYGITHWAGIWYALVATCNSNGIIINDLAVTVQTATVAQPTHSTDWTIVRTVQARGNGTARPYIFGIGAGGTIITATAHDSGWTISNTAGDTGSLTTTAITECNLHAFYLGGVIDEWAPLGTYLPVRFSGPPGSPVQVGTAVCWLTGHVDTGYLACCGDGAGGAYAIALSGDLVHWASPGASRTTVLVGLTGSATVSNVFPEGQVVTGEYVQLLQPSRTTPGQLVVHHGTGNTITRTTVTLAGPSAAASGSYDWYTDTYNQYQMFVHLDDNFVEWHTAFSTVSDTA